MYRLGRASRNFTIAVNLTRNNISRNFSQQLSNHVLRQSQLTRLRFRLAPVYQCRLLSSKKDQEEPVIEEVVEEIEESPADFLHANLPTTVAIPEVWPYLPCLAVNRNPVFPRFMKILEVVHMPMTVIKNLVSKFVLF